MGTAANMNYVAIATEEDAGRHRHRGRHRRRADERRPAPAIRRAGVKRRGHGEGRRRRRHDQHDPPAQSSDDRRGAGADGDDDDRGQERGAASGWRCRAATRAISRPAPARISSAWRRRCTASQPLTSASPHMKLGELIGVSRAARHRRSAALAERARGEHDARAVSRAGPLRREGGRACSTTWRRCSTPAISSC